MLQFSDDYHIRVTQWSRQEMRWLGRVYERSHLLCSRFSCKPKMTLFPVSHWASVVDNICKIWIFVMWPVLLVLKFACASNVFEIRWSAAKT